MTAAYSAFRPPRRRLAALAPVEPGRIAGRVAVVTRSIARTPAPSPVVLKGKDMHRPSPPRDQNAEQKGRGETLQRRFQCGLANGLQPAITDRLVTSIRIEGTGSSSVCVFSFKGWNWVPTGYHLSRGNAVACDSADRSSQKFCAPTKLDHKPQPRSLY